MNNVSWSLLALASAFAAVAEPALTIYNGNFAVVRERIPLDLKSGVTAASYAGVTVHLEPDSVVLRDPAGKVAFRVLEQSYRADPVSQGLLLSLNEGRVLDFVVRDQNGHESLVRGKVVRSGYVPNSGGAAVYGQRFMMTQSAMGDSQSGLGQPIIEVDGKLRFSLPGEPLFPVLSDDAILKPTLRWQIASEQAAHVEAELSYVTGGMGWEASYNLIAPERGDTLDLVGWVTIDNQSGRQFDEARIKLMAGDVNKIQPQQPGLVSWAPTVRMAKRAGDAEVTEKSFDEFHLYSLPRPATLRNRETKQVEFLRATGVKAKTFYVYRGALLDGPQYYGANPEMIRNDRDYGTRSNPKVWVMREFTNSEENGLGQPLPKGRTRFYRRDDADGRLEFIGENTLDHTPKNERVRLYSGDAFDVVGERRRTDHRLGNDLLEEGFEIRLRNRKTEAVEVRVEERLYRWVNWQITEKSSDFTKLDAQNVEFRVTVPPDGEKVLTYRVRYSW